MWSAAALEHFQDPRFQGVMPEPDLEIVLAEPGQPNFLRLQFRLKGDLIVDVRFSTARCLTAVACASYAARFALNKSLHELDGLEASQILADLGPFPANKSMWAAWVWGALQQVRLKGAGQC